MDVAASRTWLIKASLGVTGANFLFFAMAPSLGYPLEWSESVRLLQIVFPVFAGYLGSATHFLFRARRSASVRRVQGAPEQLALIVRGPVFLWGLASLGAIAAFGISNRMGATAPGMEIDDLATLLTAALSLLAVTTSVVVGYLFGFEDEKLGRTKSESGAASPVV